MIVKNFVCKVPFLVLGKVYVFHNFRNSFLFSQLLKRFVTSRQVHVINNKLCRCNNLDHIAEMFLQKIVLKAGSLPKELIALLNSSLFL